MLTPLRKAAPERIAALIVAAGRGTRLGHEIPKQYIPLNGPCALRRSVDLFLSLPSVMHVAVVIHADDEERYGVAMRGLKSQQVLPATTGGETRAASVLAGLEQLQHERPDAVLIHDAARPFMPVSVIEGVIQALSQAEGACAALPVVDALWSGPDGIAERSIPRQGLWRAQTPQAFWFEGILNAHRRHTGAGLDDVAVAQDAGLSVQFVQGSEQGYKITTPADLARALEETRD